MEIKRRRLSAKERKYFYDMFKGRCAYCGASVTFRGMQIDHKIPLRINGKDEPENMFPACRSCNHYKATFDIEGFREYLSGIPKRLNRDCIAYQVGRRFEIVTENDKPIKFYFEVEESNEMAVQALNEAIESKEKLS